MLINTVYSSVICEGPGCTKAATYLASEERTELSKPENAWVRTTARVVQNLIPAPGQERPQARLYCSDECEVKATATGVHNVPEPKRIVAEPANAAQVAQAAEAAARAQKATQALKAGGPVTLG